MTDEATFPGARSSVPGFHRLADEMNAASPLPLDAIPGHAELGWSIRLPVRAEDIRIEKQTLVYERVVVRRASLRDVTRLETSIRREELEVSTDLPARESTEH